VVLHRVARAGFVGVGLALAGLVKAHRIAVLFAAVLWVVGVGDGSVAAGVAQDAAGVLAALLYQVINCSKRNSCVK